MDTELYFGPVICTEGKFKGRVGFYDDDDVLPCENCPEIDCKCRDCNDESLECGVNCDYKSKCIYKAVVYWGNWIQYGLNLPCYLLDYNILSNNITVNDLVNRSHQLSEQIYRAETYKLKSELYAELLLVESLTARMYTSSRFKNRNGIKLFICHAKEDDELAFMLHSDLAFRGHDPFTYEWDITGGDNILKEISDFLDATDFLLVILSENAVKSNFVSTEWLSMFWDEIYSQTKKVIPILSEQCEIPRFLKNKKYVDFTKDYNEGFEDLLNSF